MPGAHSYWSASGFARDVACPGSKILSEGLTDRAGASAAWGTVAHDLADHCIQTGQRPSDFLDEIRESDGLTVFIDEEMTACVQDYIDQVKGLSTRMGVAADMTWSEQRVNYARWLNVDPDVAWGTLDFSAVWIEQAHLLIGDLKTGKGVSVSPTENEQLMLYAGGKLVELDELGIDIDTVELAIIQNRVGDGRAKTWSLTRAELEAWLLGRARSAVATIENARQTQGTIYDSEWQATFLKPGDHCREKFCKARATCPAYRAAMSREVFDHVPSSPDEFESLKAVVASADDPADWLAAAYAKLDLVRDWANAVEAEVHDRLNKGEPIPGYKLVAGKSGARKWADEKAVEQMLKTFRLKTEEMYDFKLISPTSAEKLAKAETIGKRQWPKLQSLITRADGKPAVVPESDPREAITVQPVAEAFEVLAGSVNDLV